MSEQTIRPTPPPSGPARPTEPVPPRRLRRTLDWDEATRLASDAYFPHVLTRMSADRTPGLTLRNATLGPVRFARIGWGTDVRIDSDHPGGYAINIPLSGHQTSVVRGVEVVSTPGQATICPPDTDIRITEWDRSCHILGVGIDRAALDRELDLAGSGPLPAQLDLTSPRGASWLRLVRSLARSAADDPDLLTTQAVGDQLAGAVTTALVLATLPESDEAPAARPRIVTRVQDAVRADPGRPWTAGDMAECAGVGVRRLQEGFRRYVGRSPSEYLLDVRLERAHADLVAAEPGHTVTDIARRWGFTHVGRFAATYRSRYGRTPSQALRG